MATHSSVLAWRIPGMGEPGGLPSIGSHRVGHDWSDLAANCCCSVAKSCPVLCKPMDCSLPGFPVPHHLPEFAQVHHWIGDATQPSHSLSPSSPSAFNLSQHQGIFWWVSSSIKWPKYWNFSISPSKEYSGLISFQIDWFDLLAVQGTLKSRLQHRSQKHQFFSTLPSSLSSSQICMWLLERPCESENHMVCLTLCNSMDCSLPGSSVHGIHQARILEWVAILLLQEIFPTQESNQGLLHCR